MKRKKTSNNKIKLLLSLFLIAIISFAFIASEGGDKRVSKGSEKVGDSYMFFINNIEMPMNKTGIMAAVSIPGYTSGGKLDGKEFLFSGGFFLSGVTNGVSWANAVASASRIEDYLAGTVLGGANDSRAQLYVLRAQDGDFAQSWDEWRDAVALGAYFYDGDCDGNYDPVDKNGNGKWDAESSPGACDGEDRPDLIADETVWCVYSDSRDPAQRRFNDVDPQGIEIRQTVFGFGSKGVVGNMIFVRYSILNTGTVADVIDSVYFGVWADPDIGGDQGYTDDLVGCDTTLNAGYVYNDGDDVTWGVDPPCFLIDFFQGPIAYIPGETFIDNNGNGEYDPDVDTPLDTAYNVQGQARGIAEFPGATNQGLSSFVHYIQSHPTQGDPNTRFEARYYMLGYDKFGSEIDPCTWTFGEVKGGVLCAEVNPKFMYSGDPVTNTGWINVGPTDQRQMSNTGPFKLVAGEPVDIVAAYVVGRGSDALNSITIAKEYDLIAQLLFDVNFPSPPPPPPVEVAARTGPDFIELSWETSVNVNYRAVDTVLDIDRRLQGYYLTMFRTNSKAGSVAGVKNAEVIATYSLDNFIHNIYQAAGNGGQNLVLQEGNRLDSVLYSDPEAGRIKVILDRDPFTQGPFIKGHEYYFTVTHFYLNHKVVVNRDSLKYGPQWPGDYLDPTGGAIEEFETPVITITFGDDLYSPASKGENAEVVSGASDGNVKYLVVTPEQLTGDTYTVKFFKNTNPQPDTIVYQPFWRLTNSTTGELLIDSSQVYNYDTTSFAGRTTDGFILKVKPLVPEFVSSRNFYSPIGDRWFQPFSAAVGTGVYYLGKDLPQKTPFGFMPGRFTNITKADRLRRVEIRFGQNGKAYRYVNGFIGNTPISRANSYRYAAGITAADTVGKGTIGKFGEGFVDVPFQAWVVDNKYKEEYQLAVGFIERRHDSTRVADYRGRPDGFWNPEPDTVFDALRESILIFDSPYDPTGSQIEFTGGQFTTPSGTETVWADLRAGYTVPADAQGVTEEQRRIASSPLFNMLYAVNLIRDTVSTFPPSGTLEIRMGTYPYTDGDEFKFTTLVGGALSESDKKGLFDKVNVFPNPLFGFNPATSFANTPADEPFVTFSNLPPEDVTVKIYTLSGTLIRTLTTTDKTSPASPYLRWNLRNEDGLRAASGLYIALINIKDYGEKILKFSIILPQKQILKY
jgi:hypothetical protein